MLAIRIDAWIAPEGLMNMSSAMLPSKLAASQVQMAERIDVKVTS